MLGNRRQHGAIVQHGDDARYGDIYRKDAELHSILVAAFPGQTKVSSDLATSAIYIFFMSRPV
jgi:hypothetical protein